MRRKLLLVPAVLLSVAVVGCASKEDVKRVDDKVTDMNAKLKVYVDSMRLYADALHDAVCKLGMKTNTTFLDQQRTKCPTGGGEGTPPPKYPPG